MPKNIIPVLPQKYENLQRRLGISPGEEQIFILSIPVQVCHLHRLLVIAGQGRAVAHVTHHAVDRQLQFLIRRRPPGYGIHLVHGLHGAAGKKQRHCKKNRQIFDFSVHGLSSFQTDIISHLLPN